MINPDLDANLGFEGRTFLTEEEWWTYRRRRPVRYIRKPYLEKCEICGLPAAEGNPFQNAHKIGFGVGITRLALTPEFLDSDKNIITTHRSVCNRSAELSIEEAMKLLIATGVVALPGFLPESMHLLWQSL